MIDIIDVEEAKGREQENLSGVTSWDPPRAGRRTGASCS